ncbi:M1 family metallopeptidase [Candidatus Poriferisodalis sp.]|uniref:M1 family metallopeptidase n=1 Tax=Candidatus Poriferisodalis sp. TaxID=3101277 RepID=UPI003B016CC9
MHGWMKTAISALAVALAFSACSTAEDDAAPAATTPPPDTSPAVTTTAESPATTALPSETTAPPPTTAAPEATSTTAPEADITDADANASADADASPPPGAGAGDSFYPWLGNSGYDVIHYDLVLDVDPDANTIDGVTTVYAMSTGKLETVYLDLSGLEVSGVKVDETAAEFSRERAELIVQPAAPIAAGAGFTVEIAYAGVPERIDDPGVPFARIGWFNQGGVIFTANEPSGSMSWFPSNNHPTDKATFTISITVPEHLTAASTGLLVEETAAGGRRTFTWQMNDPMATYLAAVYIGKFERHEQQSREGLLIRDYIPAGLPDTEREAMLEALSVTPTAIEYFEGLLGPYPFDAYGTLVVPLSFGFAMENQTLSLHSTQTLGEQIIAHELAHQWFGNSVTAADWSDIWLHEGFAHYLSFLYLAEVGDQDLDELMATEHQAIIAGRAAPPGSIDVHQLFDFNAVYQRSTLTLHALHRHLGDETFFQILRRHYDEAAGGTTTTADFTAIVAELGGIAAIDLLDDWLYDVEVPTSLGS